MSTILHRCDQCACTLVSSDYLGRPAVVMDRALARHCRGLCHADAAPANAMREVDECLSSQSAPVLWPDGEPPLVYFTRVGHTAHALELLRRGVSSRCGGIDATGHGASSALHHAATRDATDLVAALLSHGASASLTTQDDVHAGLPGGRVRFRLTRARASSAATLIPGHMTHPFCCSPCWPVVADHAALACVRRRRCTPLRRRAALGPPPPFLRRRRRLHA